MQEKKTVSLRPCLGLLGTTPFLTEKNFERRRAMKQKWILFKGTKERENEDIKESNTFKNSIGFFRGRESPGTQPRVKVCKFTF